MLVNEAWTRGNERRHRANERGEAAPFARSRVPFAHFRDACPKGVGCLRTLVEHRGSFSGQRSSFVGSVRFFRGERSPLAGERRPFLGSSKLVPRTGELAFRATKLATARAFDPGLCSRVESAGPMLTPEDLWKKLALEAGEDAITEAASVPVTQAERDLHEAGFDVKAERERANAWIGELAGENAAASDGTEPTVRLPSGPAPEPPGPKIAPVVPIPPVEDSGAPRGGMRRPVRADQAHAGPGRRRVSSPVRLREGGGRPERSGRELRAQGLGGLQGEPRRGRDAGPRGGERATGAAGARRDCVGDGRAARRGGRGGAGALDHGQPLPGPSPERPSAEAGRRSEPLTNDGALQLRASPLGGAPHRDHRHQVGVFVDRVVDVRPRSSGAARGGRRGHRARRTSRLRSGTPRRNALRARELAGEEVSRVAVLPPPRVAFVGLLLRLRREDTASIPTREQLANHFVAVDELPGLGLRDAPPQRLVQPSPLGLRPRRRPRPTTASTSSVPSGNAVGSSITSRPFSTDCPERLHCFQNNPVLLGLCG